MEQARSDLASVAASLEEEYPDSNDGWSSVIRRLEDVVLRSTRPQLLVFMASVGLLLFMACGNLTNTTLARITARTRELAIRTAVGAGRGRVVRQLLSESVLLALVGGALGIMLAAGAIEAFVTGWPSLLPRMQEIEMNGPVLAFSLGLSLGAGVLFGLVPALNVTGRTLADPLRQGSRSIAGDRSSQRIRNGLVVSEVALAVMLLVGAGLLARSFSALRSQEPGFQHEGRLVVRSPLPGER